MKVKRGWEIERNKKDFDQVKEYIKISDERFLEAQDMNEFKDRKEQLIEWFFFCMDDTTMMRTWWDEKDNLGL